MSTFFRAGVAFFSGESSKEVEALSGVGLLPIGLAVPVSGGEA